MKIMINISININISTSLTPSELSTLNCQIKQKAGSLNMSIPHGYYWVKEVIPWSCLPIPNASAAVDELNLWDSNTDLQVYWNGKSIKRVLAVRCAVFYHLLLRNAWVVRGLEGGILEQGWSHSRSTTTIFWLYDLGGGGNVSVTKGAKFVG